MRKVARIMLFGGLLFAAAVVILLTAWIAPGITSKAVGILTVVGGPFAMAIAAALGWRLRRDARVALSWALFSGGVFAAVPVHEFLHALPVLAAGKHVTLHASVTSLKTSYPPMAVWLETFRLLLPFMVSAVSILILPFIMRAWDLRVRPWEEFLMAVIIGSVAMSNVYAVVSMLGILGENGDMYHVARNLALPVPGLAVAVIGAHAATAAVAGILYRMLRDRKKPLQSR